MEEAKLKAKFPMAANRPAHSAFLQKRLLKGVSFHFRALVLCQTVKFPNLHPIFFQQKYFDSGDYQMAKQQTQPSNLAKPRPPPFIPIQTGDEIPTPETVPARKTSIIQPSHKFPHPQIFLSNSYDHDRCFFLFYSSLGCLLWRDRVLWLCMTQCFIHQLCFFWG